MPRITNSIQSCNGDPGESSKTRKNKKVKRLDKKRNKAVTIYRRCENVITYIQNSKESTNKLLEKNLTRQPDKNYAKSIICLSRENKQLDDK